MAASFGLDDELDPPAPLTDQRGCDLEQDIWDASLSLDDEDTNTSVPLSSQLMLCSDMLAEDAVALAPSSGLSDMNAGLSELASLGVSAYDHSQLEKEVMENMDKALKEQEDKKRLEEASRELRAVEEDIRFVKQRLSHIEKAISLAPKDPNQLTGAAKRELSAIKMEKGNKLKHLRKIEAKRRALQVCISGSTQEVSSSMQGEAQAALEEEGDLDEETLFRLRQVFTPKESEEERLIRTGEMTPFGTRSISIPETTDFDRFLLDAAESHASKKASKTSHRQIASPAKGSTVVVRNDKTDFQFTDLKAVPAKRRRSNLLKIQRGAENGESPSKKKKKYLVRNYKSDSEVSCFEEEEEDEVPKYSDEDVYVPDEDSVDDDDDDYNDKQNKRKQNDKKKRGVKSAGNADGSFLGPESGETKSLVKKLVDDGDQASFLKRIKAHEMSELKRKHRRILESEDGVVDSDEEDFTEFDEGFKVPNSIWNKLYKYQQTCVRWLWELHQQNCGGIIGDEMGLGKTIQVIAFLAGLSASNTRTQGDTFHGLGPVVLVCPTTVMHQWVKEFHTWWPPFRVAILHDSGSFSGKKSSLVSLVNKHRGVLVTSYAGLVSHQERLLAHDWHYIILDEGHKIRNPDAQATIVAKRFRTCHRLILSGSPVQNNLKELWSLFDFVFPGKLGTLPVFMQQFSVPIVQGGYANASQVQVQTAYKCATVLRDAIKPYLLRRMKSDVKMNINLPNKSEQVLFCKLTEEQINLYKGYINSKEVSSILNARLQVFVGLINLRKICNHPDLFDGGPKVFRDTDVSQLGEEEKYGFHGRSGKMAVVEALLRMWHSQGHRVLLFTQSRQMMDILELFVKSRGYSYMKMDGTTPISSRQPAINKFNSDPGVFVFLLTTRVGGLGVNLTGADRVVLYDPDWNPSTDAQARERAWRIGQRRQVTVYRLLTAGTIEEKIYHRQIFKQFVTNRVLKDPRQRRFFKSNDLFELFSFSELGTQGTETSAIFAGTGSEIRPKRNVRKEPHPTDPVKVAPEKVSFSEEKREQMKQLAKRLAMSLTKKGPEAKPGSTVELISKNNSEAQFVATLESDPKSKFSPDAKSETSLQLMSKNIRGATLRLELNSNKTSEKSLTDKTMSVKRASERKTVKDKLKNKVSSNGLPEERTPKKSKKRKAARVEGEKIAFVVKKSVYKPPENEEEKSKREDDYVLSKLFKTSGVHTALKHDTIVESSAPDYTIVESEALRVANEAVRALKQSRQHCRAASEGVPTWTGRTPRFGQRKLLPPGSHPIEPQTSTETFGKKTKFDGRQNQGGTTSSSDLLAAIRKRKVVFGSEDQDHQGPPLTTNKHDELLVDIRNFVAFQGSVDGQATTKEILSAFREKVPKKQTAIFKAMLKNICHFSKKGSGDGLWQLKEEFR